MMSRYRSPLIIVLLVLSFALVACSSMGNQVDYPYQSGDGGAILHVGEVGGECVLSLNGDISDDLVRAFKLAADDLASRQCISKWVVLNSLGGKVYASYAIGNLIRAKGFNTRLSSVGGICASACGMLFIGGVKREARDSTVLGAHLGFHQITHDGNCAQASAAQYKKLHGYASHLLPPQGAALFVKLVTETACNSMQTSTSFKQLKDAGIITGDSAGD